MENTDFKKTNKKVSGETTKRKTKFNHIINVFIYNNIALFKGDTYPYRGTFKRCGGDFNKQHYGYLIPLDRMAEAKLQISNFVESLMIYKKDENLDIGHISSHTILDENLDDYDSITSININSNQVLNL